MKKTLFALAMLAFAAAVSAQSTDRPTNFWKVFQQVKFKNKYWKAAGAEVPTPTFGPDIRKWEGQEIALTGFVLPADDVGVPGLVVLSRVPFSQCYFCGGAGPESICEVQTKSPKLPRFKNDQRYSFKGKLKLNDSDLEHFNFILTDAEPTSF